MSATPTANTPEQPERAPKAGRHLFGHLAQLIASHKPISIAVLLVTVVGLALGGYGAALAIRHAGTEADYKAAAERAQAANDTNNVAQLRYAITKSSATAYQAKVKAIVETSAGYIDGAARATIAISLTKLGTDLKAKPGATTLRQLDGLDSDASTDQYTRATRHLDGLAITAKKETATTQKATSTIQASQQATEAALVKMARSIDGTSKTVLGANAKADAAAQQAFAAAAKAVTDATAPSNVPTATPAPKPTATAKPKLTNTQTPGAHPASTETKPALLALVTVYLAKGKALTEAQAAAVAAEKAAADAAAQLATQEADHSSYVDSDGKNHTTPPRSGGSSSGGSSGGGSASGGGGGVAGGYVTFSGGNYTPGCAAGAQVSSGHFTNDPSPHITTSYSFPWTGSSSVSGSTSYYTIYQCSGGGAGGW